MPPVMATLEGWLHFADGVQIAWLESAFDKAGDHLGALSDVERQSVLKAILNTSRQPREPLRVVACTLAHMASEEHIASRPDVGASAPQAADAERPARPAATVIAAPPGEQPDSFTSGDFSLHRASTTKGRGGATTWLGKLIQAGERRRFGNRDYARWTHSALIVSETGEIVEAIESGVKQANISKYRDTDYVVVHVDAPPMQRELAAELARDMARRHDSYGVLNFIALAFQALFGWSISLHVENQFICSGLVARATEKYIAAYPRSPESMMPADLAAYWHAQSGEPLPKPGFLGRLLDLLGTFVDLFRKRGGDPAQA
jgi:hypothetical protein